MKPENVKCPNCNGEMLPREGPYGKFWGCKKYPDCKGTRDSMGRSKADRDEWKRQQEIDKQQDHEDVGPDSIQRYYNENNEVKVTFKKKG